MVAMRDGVRMATDIYRPAVDGPFPVILERTPYDKSALSRSERTAEVAKPRSRAEVADYFVAHGYAVVYQDCRGRYHSEGGFTKYLSDAEDGFDAVAWLTRQPWCNGKVATMGLSYAAHTQAALGCLAPPGLAAQFLDCGGFANAYQGGIRQGGAFELKQATWAYRNAIADSKDAAVKAALGAQDIKQWFARLPWHKGDSPLAAAPEFEDYLFEQWSHGTFDDYWKQPGIYAAGFYDRYADVPMVHMSGWYDPYSRTATDNYMGLSKRKRGPVRLIIGPWTHGDRSLTYAGDVDFGSAATLDHNVADDFWALRLRWFDRWLKGTANGVEREPPVRVFVMGGGSGRRNAAGRLDHGGAWRYAADWPLPEARATRFYLHADRTLSTARSSEGAAPLSYVYDPADPVPSIGGTITSGAPIMVGGAFDQRTGPRIFGAREPYRALAARPDVLVFESAPLERDVEVTGPITVSLWVASSSVDTDITAKLIDVHPPNEDYPDGFAMNLTDGILRVRYRESWEHPAMMTPRTVYAIAVEAFPTANLFKRGHRIRIDVSSSNFPHFDVNPNTGDPEGTASRWQRATNLVYVDAAHPSHVLLPVIERRV
ncbi:MAG: CocE/NonD family hydrolase [Alphaproteobacteria bacterium]|nr:CocE/NonD family hydrolase [Alphaproteobacteria bacterium]